MDVSSVSATAMADKFSDSCEALIRCRISSQRLTTYGTGGTVDALIEPQTPEQLVETIQFVHEYGIKYRVLGAGSNVLIPDTGLSDWVIKLGKGFGSYTFLSDTEIEAGGAVPLMTLSNEICRMGLAGLEFAGGIPASLGGAVKMNAGAHGSEISSVVKEISWITPLGENKSGGDLTFDYRSCGIEAGSIIYEVRLKLEKDDPVTVMNLRAMNLAYRKATQPLQYPSSGSVFKNPSDSVSAGYLIEQAGLKGTRIGGAEVSSLHANWIINPERKATSADIVNLIELCIEKVATNSNVTLEPELIIWE